MACGDISLATFCPLLDSNLTLRRRFSNGQEGNRQFTIVYVLQIFSSWLSHRSDIRLPRAHITEVHLLEAIKQISSEDTIQVQEFTSMLDNRTLPPTVGLFIELQRPLGAPTYEK